VGMLKERKSRCIEKLAVPNSDGREPNVGWKAGARQRNDVAGPILGGTQSDIRKKTHENKETWKKTKDLRVGQVANQVRA